MITIEQWRCAIGGFDPPRSADLCSKAERKCVSFQDYTFSARLIVMSFVSWGFYFQLSLVDQFVIPNVVTATVNVMTDCVLSDNAHITNICYDSQRKFLFFQTSVIWAGEIESNPGPTTTQLSLMVKTAREEIATLKNRLKRAKKTQARIRNQPSPNSK